MIRRKLPVIIFLVNNQGYTIEVEIHDGPYNNIKNWDYAGLIKVFNAEDGQVAACAPEWRRARRSDQGRARQPRRADADRMRHRSRRLHAGPDLLGQLVAAANARPPRPQ